MLASVQGLPARGRRPRWYQRWHRLRWLRGHVGVVTRGEREGEGVRAERDERAMSPGNAKLSESTQKVRLPKSKAVKWSRRASRKASRSALQGCEMSWWHEPIRSEALSSTVISYFRSAAAPSVSHANQTYAVVHVPETSFDHQRRIFEASC